MTTTDLPASAPPPEVRRVRVWICRCETCGRKVRGRHLAVAEGQKGATAHRLGPLVKAAALALHHDFGIPQRKVPAVIESMTGLRVTQGALTQWAEGAAEGKAGEVAECLAAAVRHAPVVNTDDTGWRIGGEQGWLMVFVTRSSTVFRIRRRHRSDEVLEIVPRNYAGVMGTDRGAS
ncbi:MAG: transposase, partial [Candidatus Sumerlaeota bacterium]|nr:transposase [Candidatus Sumerlaeota bacterium]